MIRVYTASRLEHGPFLEKMLRDNPNIITHARWLKHVRVGTPDTPDYAADFWLQDEQDIRCADAVLVYAGDGNPLRGALVEAGMAIAMGVPVVAVIPKTHPSYGTWAYHPGVIEVFDTLADAIDCLEAMSSEAFAPLASYQQQERAR